MTARFPFAVLLALALWAVVVAAARADEPAVLTLTALRCINHTDKPVIITVKDGGVVELGRFFIPAHGGLKTSADYLIEFADKFGTIEKVPGVRCHAKWGRKP